MKRLTILLLIALLLSSCDIFMDEPEDSGRNYLIAIGMGYMQNPRISRLNNTYNDFRGIVEQFETLSELAGKDYEVTTFSDFASRDGKIVFGFDHRTSCIGDGPIFNPDTERMRKPEILPIDETSRDTIRTSLVDDLIKVFESTSTPTEDDTIIFYYTGHGTAKGGPVFHHSDSKDIVYTDFSMKDIEERFFSRYESRIIVILDCCYSGRWVDNSELGSTLQFQENMDRDGNSEYRMTGFNIADGFEKGFDESRPLPRIIYLTACSGDQMSYDYDPYLNGWNSDRYGAFTYQVLKCWGYDTEAMASSFPISRKGQSISVGDMYRYIRDNMSSANREKSTPSITRSRYDVTLFSFNP